MTCSEFVHRLDAFVDGETSLEESCDIAVHLENCDACRARVDELRDLTDVVRDELKHERAPADLWSRIEAKLPETAERDAPSPPPAWWRQQMRPLALAASIILLIGIATGIGRWLPSSDYGVVTAPVQDFATYRLSGRDVDVDSTDPGIVQAWFEEKLTFELPPLKARIAGFDLVGGRLCWFLDRRIGALAYQRGDQVVAVYVMADYNLPLPEATFDPELAISRSVHEVDDVSSMIWHEDGLVYSVVSDLKVTDLSIFLAALARNRHRNADAITDVIDMAKAPT